jgi:S-methylmethionine-dependent homocysteine/selenocysteine methylase
MKASSPGASPDEATGRRTMADSTPVTLLDGGTGRELLRIGAPFRQPEWSALALMEAPHFVSRVHGAFVAAGADVITTNSYALVPFHLGAERFARDGEALAALAGRLAREVADAAPRGVQVAGCLPPPCGSYRADWFDPAPARPILQTLVRALAPSVDHWLAETLSSVAEAKLVREAVGDDARPLWLSFTLDDGDPVPGRPRLRSGEPVQAAVDAAARLGAEALLFNCSQPEVMGDAVDAACARPAGGGGARIGVYANAFAPQSAQAQANDGLSELRPDLGPEGYLAWVRDWIARGATIVGGCCGIGPEHIERIRRSLPAGP